MDSNNNSGDSSSPKSSQKEGTDIRKEFSMVGLTEGSSNNKSSENLNETAENLGNSSSYQLPSHNSARGRMETSGSRTLRATDSRRGENAYGSERKKPNSRRPKNLPHEDKVDLSPIGSNDIEMGAVNGENALFGKKFENDFIDYTDDGFRDVNLPQEYGEGTVGRSMRDPTKVTVLRTTLIHDLVFYNKKKSKPIKRVKRNGKLKVIRNVSHSSARMQNDAGEIQEKHGSSFSLTEKSRNRENSKAAKNRSETLDDSSPNEDESDLEDSKKLNDSTTKDKKGNDTIDKFAITDVSEVEDSHGEDGDEFVIENGDEEDEEGEEEEDSHEDIDDDEESLLSSTDSRAENHVVEYIVVDEFDRPIGRFSMIRLQYLDPFAVATTEKTVEDLMGPLGPSVEPNSEWEDAYKFFDNEIVGGTLPIVEKGVLFGVVYPSDALKWFQDEADMRAEYLAGMGGNLRKYSESSIWFLFIKRAPWLVALTLINLGTVLIIGQYEEIIESNIVLASFLPLIVDSGGNIGAQVATMIIGAISARDVTSADMAWIFRKELMVSLCIGGLMAFIGFMLGFTRQGVQVGLVVASALAVIAVMTNFIGMVLPFIATKLNQDPAVSSSPILTSLADFGGVFIFLAFAQLILGGIDQNGEGDDDKL